MRTFAILLVLASVAQAQQYDPKDFDLKPGEILVAVNGVPVSQLQIRHTKSVASNTLKTIGSISSRIVNRDQAAYNHALREAQILASRRASGHPLGVAPGCFYSGTGTSTSPEIPNHCYKNMPESRLVARAVVASKDGKLFYWSAHYR